MEKKRTKKYNNFFYDKDDKFHKKGDERKDVNLRISFNDLTDNKDDIKKYGLDYNIKNSFHIIRETIIDGEMYELEMLKLNKNKWYVYLILHVVEWDKNSAGPAAYEEISLDTLKQKTPVQLNIFGVEDYE